MPISTYMYKRYPHWHANIGIVLVLNMQYLDWACNHYLFAFHFAFFTQFSQGTDRYTLFAHTIYMYIVWTLIKYMRMNICHKSSCQETFLCTSILYFECFNNSFVGFTFPCSKYISFNFIFTSTVLFVSDLSCTIDLMTTWHHCNHWLPLSSQSKNTNQSWDLSIFMSLAN